MSNLEMLQKLSEGLNKTQKIQINFEDEDYEFTMRPLTDGELSELRKLENSNFAVKVKLDDAGKRRGKPQKETNDNETTIDGGKFSETRDLIKYKAVALSLSCDGEEIPEDAVKDLSPGLPDLLFAEVIKISALSDDDLTTVKNFRKNN